MAKTKISKIAKDLNISVPTVVEFLNKKNINIDASPNTRVEDDVVDVLLAEFDKDGSLKRKMEATRAKEQKEVSQPVAEPTKPAEPVKEAEEPAKVESRPQPKIVGKVTLDKNGMPVKPSETEKKKTEKPAEQPVKEAKVEEKKRPAKEAEPAKPVEKPVVEEKTEVKEPEPQKTKEEPAKETPKAEETPKAKETTEQKEQKGKPSSDISPVETKAEEDDSFIATRTPQGPTLNIVGKIDLTAINQTTRPKKKTKEERRKERSGQQGGGNENSAGTGDRKKRKRIGGKEKIDIEKTGAQTESNSGSRRDKRRGEGKRGNHVPVQVQAISDEDVSKQVRETLARLTAKDRSNTKKGAKWRREKREANAEAALQAAAEARAESKVLKLTEFVTANDLALMMDVPITQVIATCMNIGVMVSINQRLDAETINIVAEEFGFNTEFVSSEVAEAIQQEEDREEDLESRPPIVTVMGHVDHGKTSLLDYIRKANVIAGEAGGITQHIGAYNVKLPSGRHITFLDTPGHEAFTAMRARGAKVTDLCIIIVAADDSVMPQTVEAINHASAAGVPIVFAINKIDKPHANPDKIKEELAAMNYLVEDWGGKYQSQDISAKQGLGVEELMEKVLLEAEMLELRANPNRNATGSIIESSLDKGRGYVATVLVQNGTLRVGDIILAGNHFGKIKAMFNERNQRIKEAGPATPALILGLNGAPTAGDTFNVMDTEQEAREIANKREQLQREQGLRTTKMLTLEEIARRSAIGNFQELNIIVKGDVDGSIEALSDSLIKLSTPEIQVNVLHKAVGEISESDVTLAAASNAIIIGFQVRPSIAARKAAERDGVEIRLYSVIYQAIEEVKDAMAGMLAPEIKEEISGTAEVLETYHISKVGTIAGCMVRDGKIKRSCKVRLIRDGIVRYTGELGSLKRFKDDVKEVSSGYDCGLSIQNYNDLKVGDMIEAFEEVEVERTL